MESNLFYNIGNTYGNLNSWFVSEIINVASSSVGVL